MSKVINLDMYRMTGDKTNRVVVIDHSYLNRRVRRYCSFCKETTLQDPYPSSHKCCICDFYNKETDLGQVVLIGDSYMKV